MKEGAEKRGTKIIAISHYAPTLIELQKMVGGYIEILALDKTTQMIVDEEGLLKDKPCNQIATGIARKSESLYDGIIIVGDVVILSGDALVK